MNLFRSPILRLTFWYVVIIMAISVMFSAMIYEIAASQFQAGFPPQQRFFQDDNNIIYPPYEDRIRQLFEGRYQVVTSRLKERLLLLNIAVLGAAGLVSYLLAKRTLRPIEIALDDQRQFTADASHELRTPLAAMKTEIEVALNDDNPAEHTRVLKSNLEEIGKLEKLSSSLLKLARHEDEQRRPIVQAVALEHVVHEACHRVDALAQRKHITIERQEVSGTVRGDEGSLTDLVVILLDNAIKFSPEHSTITVTTRRTQKHLIVSVADHGVGIAAADLPQVFTRFYRTETSRTKAKTDGYGLGLAIAKQIVDRHHGTIKIQSIQGKGTTVTFSVPRV